MFEVLKEVKGFGTVCGCSRRPLTGCPNGRSDPPRGGSKRQPDQLRRRAARETMMDNEPLPGELNRSITAGRSSGLSTTVTVVDEGTGRIPRDSTRNEPRTNHSDAVSSRLRRRMRDRSAPPAAEAPGEWLSVLNLLSAGSRPVSAAPLPPNKPTRTREKEPSCKYPDHASRSGCS